MLRIKIASLRPISFAMAFFVVLPSYVKSQQTSERERLEYAYLEAARAVLVPSISETKFDDNDWLAYFDLVDEDTFNRKKKDAGFMGKMVSTYGPASANFDYKSFKEAHARKYHETHKFTSSQQSASTLQRFLTSDQLKAYQQIIERILGRSGLFISEVSAMEDAIVFGLSWTVPPGASTATVDAKVTVVGGELIGESPLSPGQYQVTLTPGANMLTVRRPIGSAVSFVVAAGGTAESKIVESTAARAARSASFVGTVVASMLPPNQYSRATGDTARYDPDHSLWVPADGRNVSGSMYAELIGATVPDLRGMFVRGINQFEAGNPVKITEQQGDPTDKQFVRIAGHAQEDMFEKHSHTGRFAGKSGKGVQHHQPQKNQVIVQDPVKTTDETGGDETRPRNVGMYYYIRIN